jgi:hypothetical protein
MYYHSPRCEAKSIFKYQREHASHVKLYGALVLGHILLDAQCDTAADGAGTRFGQVGTLHARLQRFRSAAYELLGSSCDDAEVSRRSLPPCGGLCYESLVGDGAVALHYTIIGLMV